MASGTFCHLPDVVLLNVLKHLNLEDLVNISKSCRRMQCLCKDRTAVRIVSLEGQYHTKLEDLQNLISESADHILHLNLDHSYWLNQRAISWMVSQCKYLVTLRVVECRVKTAALVKLVAACPQLRQLTFSISSFANIKKDVFVPAKNTLQGLRKLGIYYSSREMALMNYFGEHATLLDCCDSLEELHIGSAGMAIPELYRPILTCPLRLKTLRTMTITSNIHAGAQMMFYGTLSQLPNTAISWKNLLMPNVNLHEFVTKTEFKGCLGNMVSMESLDVSGSKVMFPCDGVDITTATQLQYLNISMTSVTSDQLKIIATSCNKLRSINLFGCTYIFQGREGLDFTGFESVFDNCPSLEVLNIAGAHHHLFMLPEHELEQIRGVFAKMKGIKRLSLPICLLAEAGQSHTRTGKRHASSPKSNLAKRRCLDHSVLACDENSDRESSPSTSSCSSPTHPASPIHYQSGVLAALLRDNSHVEELEILAVNFHSAIHKNKIINPKTQQFGPCTETRRVRDAALESISHLKDLRKLVLVGAPGLVSGQCLVAVSRECQKLHHLEVGYLGAAIHGNIFSQALKHLRSLKDLRLEHPHMCLNAALFENLQHCRSLTRLCIITKHSTFNSTDVVKLMEQLQRLVVFQLFAGGTITACRVLTNTLHKRFSKQRPALSCSIYPLIYDGISDTTKSIPAKHFDELTLFQSRVGFVPPAVL